MWLGGDFLHHAIETLPLTLRLSVAPPTHHFTVTPIGVCYSHSDSHLALSLPRFTFHISSFPFHCPALCLLTLPVPARSCQADLDVTNEARASSTTAKPKIGLPPPQPRRHRLHHSTTRAELHVCSLPARRPSGRATTPTSLRSQPRGVVHVVAPARASHPLTKPQPLEARGRSPQSLTLCRGNIMKVRRRCQQAPTDAAANQPHP